MEVTEPILTMITSGQLQIDKGTYFTVIISQLTIYGILLTFIQFLAAANFKGQNITDEYMGKEVKNYYLYQKLKVFKIINGRPFYLLWAVFILLKPALWIFGGRISETGKAVSMFIWYLGAVLYMILFAYIFVEFARISMTLKRAGRISTWNWTFDQIDKDFLKKKRKGNKSAALKEALEELAFYQKSDNNEYLKERYGDIRLKLLNDYLQQKKKWFEIYYKENKSDLWVTYKIRTETELFYQMIKAALAENLQGKAMELLIIDWKEILDLSWFFLKPDNTDRPYFQRGPVSQEYEAYDELFKSCKEFGVLEHTLQRFEDSFEFRYGIVGEDIDRKNQDFLKNLLRNSLFRLDGQKESAKTFCRIFGSILSNEDYGEFYLGCLLDRITDGFRTESDKLLEHLGARQRVYFLSFLVIYHSVYSFRFQWEKPPIVMLRNAVQDEEMLTEIYEKEQVYLIQRFSRSRISHRVSGDVIQAFFDSMKEPFTDQLLLKIHRENLLEPFYIFMVRICVFGKRPYFLELMDWAKEKLDVEFIRYFSRYPEILSEKNVRDLFFTLRLSVFYKAEEIPRELLNDFEMLVLCDYRITEKMMDKWVESDSYIPKALVKYMLIKITNGDSSLRQEHKEWVREHIRRAFFDADTKTETFVDEIAHVYQNYQLTLPFVSRERMKIYLQELI